MSKFKRKNISENWVEKTLTSRFKKPIYITVLIIFIIVLYSLYIQYEEINILQNKQDKVTLAIKEKKIKLSKIIKIINKQEESLITANDMLVNEKQPLLYLTKVCELLKNKKIIGSFYISKSISKEYKNVMEFDIKISYGDKKMLKTIATILLDKLFYLKKITITKTGIKCELYKPV